MRALRPDLLFSSETDLWLVDESQPVAVVVDGGSGAVLHTLAWPQVPPGRRQDSPRRAVHDGTALWVQEDGEGPLVRVGLRGIEFAVWTHGPGLAACGPTAAWCAPRPHGQELLAGEGANPPACWARSGSCV